MIRLKSFFVGLVDASSFKKRLLLLYSLEWNIHMKRNGSQKKKNEEE
jgi:hypothetical protein